MAACSAPPISATSTITPRSEMALFFDAEWFDARLKAAGLPREALAAALGLTAEEISDLWKDQREVSAEDVRLIASLIGAGADDVARHAGISTPAPKPPCVDERLSRIEAELAAVKAELAALKAKRT